MTLREAIGYALLIAGFIAVFVVQAMVGLWSSRRGASLPRQHLLQLSAILAGVAAVLGLLTLVGALADRFQWGFHTP